MSQLIRLCYSLRNTIRMSNCLDKDQGQRFVGPDLGPYCLQWLSTDDKIAASKQKVKGSNITAAESKLCFNFMGKIRLDISHESSTDRRFT